MTDHQADDATVKREIFTQDTLTFGDGRRIILQIPEYISVDDYKDFASWIDLQLKKIARINVINSEKE